MTNWLHWFHLFVVPVILSLCAVYSFFVVGISGSSVWSLHAVLCYSCVMVLDTASSLIWIFFYFGLALQNKSSFSFGILVPHGCYKSLQSTELSYVNRESFKVSFKVAVT